MWRTGSFGENAQGGVECVGKGRSDRLGGQGVDIAAKLVEALVDAHDVSASGIGGESAGVVGRLPCGLNTRTVPLDECLGHRGLGERLDRGEHLLRGILAAGDGRVGTEVGMCEPVVQPVDRGSNRVHEGVLVPDVVLETVTQQCDRCGHRHRAAGDERQGRTGDLGDEVSGERGHDVESTRLDGASRRRCPRRPRPTTPAGRARRSRARLGWRPDARPPSPAGRQP